jgi:hypothetical protein
MDATSFSSRLSNSQGVGVRRAGRDAKIQHPNQEPIMLPDTKSLLLVIRSAKPELYPEYVRVIKARLSANLPDQDRAVLTAERDRLEGEIESPPLPSWLGGSTFRG